MQTKVEVKAEVKADVKVQAIYFETEVMCCGPSNVYHVSKMWQVNRRLSLGLTPADHRVSTIETWDSHK